MRLTVSFERGQGEETAVIGPGAIVSWEMRTKKKVSTISDGLALTDVIELLAEQLRLNGETIPRDVAEFARTLEVVTPIETVTPVPTAPEASQEVS